MANAPTNARIAASTLSRAMSETGWLFGSAGRTGTYTRWCQGSPTWPSVGGRRVSLARVGSSAPTWGWRQDSPTWASVGGRRASCLLGGSPLAWAMVVTLAKFMAASTAPMVIVRASLDMAASYGSERPGGALPDCRPAGAVAFGDQQRHGAPAHRSG